MLLTFQMMLENASFPPRDVRLIRHVKRPRDRGLSPYQAWRENRPLFEAYQAAQVVKDRRYFSAPYWAAFVATPAKETLFVGLYAVELAEKDVAAFTCPWTGRENEAGLADRYITSSIEAFAPYEGKLIIDWGLSARTWGQYAERRQKKIIELRREVDEPAYPGHSAFMTQLSQIPALPNEWRAILSAARGVYLLTCPRTKEQYVGEALSNGGFLARWTQHAAMQGDAIAFRSRNPEDYRVSILEVAGSLATDDDICRMETRWKEKLQSREMGLNRN